MHLQWFPGHMTKAMRMMEEEIKLCDGVIYVLDARAPFACINKKLNALFGGKPIVYLLNKSDLVESEDITKIIQLFKVEGNVALPCSYLEGKTLKSVVTAVKNSLQDKIERNKQKGVNKPLRIMVAGIPNTGKSTVINGLSGSKRAVTGDKAGVTKGKQWIKLDGLELLDTPGTMPPSFDSQKLALYLAYIGCINDDILDMQELCLELIKELKTRCPELLSKKYNLTVPLKESLEIYEEICKNRGFLIRGGECDYERCAKAVIDDLRKGRIGKVSFYDA